MQGNITGIHITPRGTVICRMSSDYHRCHSRKECDVWLTQEEAWAQWQKRQDERAKAQAAKMANSEVSSGAKNP